jgi:hypothetical protein
MIFGDVSRRGKRGRASNFSYIEGALRKETKIKTYKMRKMREL